MKELIDLLMITALFDIRVETLAATLISKSEGFEEAKAIDLEQVVVSPLGDAKRRSGMDVKAVKKKHYDEETVLFIEVNRKGLFDTLPERLFLDLDAEYENAVKRTRAIKQQIKDVRKFFLPFEQAMYHPRIECDQLEQKWTEFFPDFIKKIWSLQDFADCLDDRQQFLLCYLIPEAYRIAGNWELTGLCFEAVLQKPIDIQFIPPLELEIPPSEGISLGNDIVLGNKFMDDVPALQVNVKGVTFRELPEYLEGGNQLRILEEFLYNYFIPMDVIVVTKIEVTEDAWSLTLGEAFLGYNVILN